MAQMEINKDLVISDSNVSLEQLTEKALPTVLYNSTDTVQGDVTPVTLYDDWHNYTFIEVWYNIYEVDSKKKAIPSSYGLRYAKIYTSTPYLGVMEGYDGRLWGSYWSSLLMLTGTNTLTNSQDRGYRVGGSEGSWKVWWQNRNCPAIVKVIGWKY